MKPIFKKQDYPVYLSLSEEQWEEKLLQSKKLASPCVLCGRRCEVQRFVPDVKRATASKPSRGVCQVQDKAVVASAGPHFGEEPPLVGQRGSGTIFFPGCNLKCIYCQNYDIAHFCRGQEVSDQQLAQIMLRLQEMGCHNINLVSPLMLFPTYWLL